MYTILIKSFTFVFIIFLGYALKRIGLFKTSDRYVLETMIIRITLPATIIHSFSTFERDGAMFLIVLLGLLCSVIPFFTAFFLSPGRPKEERAYKMITTGGYNIGCFALPIVQAFYGSAAVVPACMFDTGNAIIVTGGSYALASSLLRTNPEEKLDLRSFIGKFLSSVPFDTYMLMLLLAALNLRLPGPVYEIAGTISGANGFLAMLMFGMAFELRLDGDSLREAGFVLFFRYLFAAFFSFVLYRFTPFDAAVRRVLAITAFAPLSALAPIYTEKCKGDPALASFTGSLTIIFSFLCMTGLALILGV